MILPFINIRKVPREMLKTGFNTSIGTLRMLMNGKSCLIPMSRNFSKFLRKISQSYSAKCRRVSPRTFAKKTLGEISKFYFSPRKKIFCVRGEPRRNAKKELFFLADLYVTHHSSRIVDCLLGLVIELSSFTDLFQH